MYEREITVNIEGNITGNLKEYCVECPYVELDMKTEIRKSPIGKCVCYMYYTCKHSKICERIFDIKAMTRDKNYEPQQ